MLSNVSNPLPSHSRTRISEILKRLLAHGILLVGSVAMVVPFLWMISTSLKEPGSIFIYPPKWIPQPIAWKNYLTTITIMPFGRFFLNSSIQATLTTVLQLLTSSLAAFSFARLRFRGRDILFLLYIATLMIPFQVTMVPNFILMRFLGWIDTYYALILPRSFHAFSIFLLRQYLKSIPLELDDAARIDGASSLRIWWSLALPLSTPALASLAIFIFMGEWNNFLWPLIVTSSEKMRTLPVGLAAFRGQFNVQWHLLMAGSALSLVPVLIVFILGQRYFVRGITLTGMGGR